MNDCALSYLISVLFPNVYNIHCGQFYKNMGLYHSLNIRLVVVSNRLKNDNSYDR
jgi:hypothetical protein